MLKERWGFRGIVVSDWNGIGQVRFCSNADCAAAINAGIDIAMEVVNRGAAERLVAALEPLSFSHLLIGLSREVGVDTYYLDVRHLHEYERQDQLLVILGHVTVGFDRGIEQQIVDERGAAAPPGPRLPVLGPVASGMLSLLLAGSLVVLAMLSGRENSIQQDHQAAFRRFFRQAHDLLRHLVKVFRLHFLAPEGVPLQDVEP
mgnify:CR=1 FL=1